MSSVPDGPPPASFLRSQRSLSRPRSELRGCPFAFASSSDFFSFSEREQIEPLERRNAVLNNCFPEQPQAVVTPRTPWSDAISVERCCAVDASRGPLCFWSIAFCGVCRAATPVASHACSATVAARSCCRSAGAPVASGACAISAAARCY